MLFVFVCRSSSTGSIVSMVSSESCGTDLHTKGHGISSFVEAFLKAMLLLQYKRERKPSKSFGLMSLSPLHSKITERNYVVRLSLLLNQCYVEYVECGIIF